MWIGLHGCKLISAYSYAVKHLSSNHWPILIGLATCLLPTIFSLQDSIQKPLEKRVLGKKWDFRMTCIFLPEADTAEDLHVSCPEPPVHPKCARERPKSREC